MGAKTDNASTLVIHPSVKQSDTLNTKIDENDTGTFRHTETATFKHTKTSSGTFQYKSTGTKKKSNFSSMQSMQDKKDNSDEIYPFVSDSDKFHISQKLTSAINDNIMTQNSLDVFGRIMKYTMCCVYLIQKTEQDPSLFIEQVVNNLNKVNESSSEFGANIELSKIKKELENKFQKLSNESKTKIDKVMKNDNSKQFNEIQQLTSGSSEEHKKKGKPSFRQKLRNLFGLNKKYRTNTK